MQGDKYTQNAVLSSFAYNTNGFGDITLIFASFVGADHLN
jgi:hypothetical protein